MRLKFDKSIPINLFGGRKFGESIRPTFTSLNISSVLEDNTLYNVSASSSQTRIYTTCKELLILLNVKDSVSLAGYFKIQIAKLNTKLLVYSLYCKCHIIDLV